MKEKTLVRKAAHSNVPLSEWIAVERIFTPAASIAGDLPRLDELPSYEFSPKTIGAIRQVINACDDGQHERAFSIIGPYGSGKSTLGLYLLALLTKRRSARWIEDSLVSLTTVDPELAARARELTARAEYVELIIDANVPSFASAAIDAFRAMANTEPWASKELKSALRVVSPAADSLNRHCLRLLRILLRDVDRADKRGVLIVSDEFGRFLDQTAGAHSSANLALAQDIAELTHQSARPQLLLLLFLHQNLESYQLALSRNQRVEWSKIQGRFRQVSFQEAPEGLTNLVARSIVHRQPLEQRVRTWARETWPLVKDLPCFSTGNESWRDQIQQAYPLHPLGLIALPHLATMLGQNERTLFSFLNSAGPRGLRHFIQTHQISPSHAPTLSLDWLCDYFVLSLDLAATPHKLQRQLSRISVSLERVADGAGIETRIVKVVGVLGLLAGRSNLWPTKGAIAAALDIRGDEQWATFDRTLDALVDAKLLVHRRYADEFFLWEGTDFNVDEALEHEVLELGPEFDTAKFLGEEFPIAPITARRHSFETGTVRRFAVGFVSEADAIAGTVRPSRSWRAVPSEPDGEILIDCSSDESIANAVRQTDDDTGTRVFVRPNNARPLLELARDAAALRRILTDNLQVKSDAIACREVELRLDAVERALQKLISEILSPSACAATWWTAGKLMPAYDERELQGALSALCTRHYSRAPKIQNELINRRQLSTSVVVAAKKIVGGLLRAEGELGLAFQGNGPEVSIFRSVFETTGIYHANEVGVHGLRPPLKRSTLYRTWAAIERFVSSSAEAPRTIDTILLELSGSPYGIRPGLSPLLVLAFLIYHQSECCLYERGTYLPVWSAELYDRLVRRPEEFSIRFFGGSQLSRDIVGALHESLPKGKPLSCGPRDGINAFLQDLYSWYGSLPDYSRKTTNLSEAALNFRRTISSASDPIELIARRLPEALGLPKGDVKPTAYARKFRAVVAELDAALADLLKRLCSTMCGYAGIGSSAEELRRYLAVVGVEELKLSDIMTRAFLLRAQDSDMDSSAWVQSLAAAITGQPPGRWSQLEADEFDERIVLVFDRIRAAQRAKHLEGLDVGTRRVIIESGQGVLLDEIVGSAERDLQTASLDKVTEKIREALRELPPRKRLLALATAVEDSQVKRKTKGTR